MMNAELFSGRGWRIVEEEAALPDGRVKKAVRAHRCGAVHVLALQGNGTVLLLREYRPFYQKWIWMLPSGHIDKESDPDIAAQRELQEETGFRAQDIHRFCIACHSESFVSANYFYIARSLVADPLPKDADELMEVHEVTLEEAIERVLESPFIHTPSAFALFRFMYEKK